MKSFRIEKSNFLENAFAEKFLHKFMLPSNGQNQLFPPEQLNLNNHMHYSLDYSLFPLSFNSLKSISVVQNEIIFKEI